MLKLVHTARTLVAGGKGLLVADENVATTARRLENVGAAAAARTRREYRQLLVTTPGLGEWISGIILCDETFGHALTDGTPFPQACAAAGVMPGIRVDTGTTPLAFADGGLITEGLDGLRSRLIAYRAQGAVFAKWRAVFSPTGLSRRTVHANTHALARYAAVCQEVGVVPVVESEVLMQGAHSIAMCQAVTANTLEALFTDLDRMSVDPRALLLRCNMVLPGAGKVTPVDAHDVAGRTVQVLQDNVPPTVPGVTFLSGGQTNEQASANLAAICAAGASSAEAPWRLTFSFGRALVDEPLRMWRGDGNRVRAAQRSLAENCRSAVAAASTTSSRIESIAV